MYPEIIVGSPGCGKTTTLLNILEDELTSGTEPERIGFVSFTKKAAEEAASRASVRFNLDRKRLPHFRTLHSLCFRQLGLRRDDVLEGKRLKEFADYAGVPVSGRWSEDGTLLGFERGDRVIFMENVSRVRRLSLRQQYDYDDDNQPWDEVRRVADSLLAFKKERGLLDYTDMLEEFIASGIRVPLDVLLVDECFLGDTPILLDTDGSWMTIKEIVETGFNGNVVSWCPKRGVVRRKVIGHKRIVRNEPLIQIKFKVKETPKNYGHNIVVCTSSHRVKTEHGWTKARDLKVGSTVFVETSQRRVATFQHRHKISEKGKQNIKKEEWLANHDYSVIRFTNKEVRSMTPLEIEARIYPKCFVEAEVISLHDYTSQDTYVYDIEIEDTHCYFAHGLLVHNCQDLSRLQWQVVSILAKNCRRTIIAGDDDQAIFQWSGADVNSFIDMPGRVTVLGQSFRVPRNVQRIAMNIITKIRHRRPKEWAPRDVSGYVAQAQAFRHLALDDEDDGGPNPPILVLVRNDYLLAEEIEPVLRERGILYERRGRLSVPPDTLAAIKAWEKLRQGASMHVADCRRIYKFMHPVSGFKPGFRELENFDDDVTLSIAELRRGGGLLVDGPWFEALGRIRPSNVNYIKRILQAKQSTTRPRVRLSTIHGAKGGEANHVILLKEMAMRPHREMELNPDAEARVAYVAVTRARERLTLVDSRTSESFRWL